MFTPNGRLNRLTVIIMTIILIGLFYVGLKHFPFPYNFILAGLACIMEVMVLILRLR